MNHILPCLILPIPLTPLHLSCSALSNMLDHSVSIQPSTFDLFSLGSSLYSKYLCLIASSIKISFFLISSSNTSLFSPIGPSVGCLSPTLFVPLFLTSLKSLNSCLVNLNFQLSLSDKLQLLKPSFNLGLYLFPFHSLSSLCSPLVPDYWAH